MKRKKARISGFRFSGILIFFAIIALIIQVAVLVYDYIIQHTQDKGLIALLMLFVIIILAILCTVFDVIRRRITVERPVNKILAATEQIAAGDFSVRLTPDHPYGKYTEYDVIMENLNRLAIELGKSEVLKLDFISNVSHELKTPLSVIRNYASLLRVEMDEETRAQYLNALIGASDRLTNLITNILKLNKLENRQLKPEMEKFNLTESIAQTVLQFEELIEKKQIELVCDLEEVSIYSCAGYLEIVWSNLLSNALKFTENGGTVGVFLNREGENVRVRIQDSGCGISTQTGARIFEKFYQGDTSHAQEGNGLGLALVKRVIDVLGGEISVTSEVNKGSTFTILLKGVVNA